MTASTSSGPDVETIECVRRRWISGIPVGRESVGDCPEWPVRYRGYDWTRRGNARGAHRRDVLHEGRLETLREHRVRRNDKRVAATAIVAWLWAGMFANTIQAGGFVGGLVWAAIAADVGGALFPAATFILAALFTTGIGTGYGAAVAFSARSSRLASGSVRPVLLFGAILSGAVFGDNLAPVSDTTIVSAVTQDADIGGVVASRFKYADVAAVLALAAYVFAGIRDHRANVPSKHRTCSFRMANQQDCCISFPWSSSS